MISNPQSLAMASERRRRETPDELDRWLTPKYILSQLGPFDLDPCADQDNPTWCECPARYTKSDDGLGRPWFGRVFMNPPFSSTHAWIRKHADHGVGVSLVPASIESRLWHETIWRRARGILLLNGRTRFCNPDGSMTTGRPLRSIALVAWSGSDRDILRQSVLSGVFLEQWSQR